MPIPRILATALCFILLLLARPARALGPLDIEVAAIGGYSTNQLDGDIGGRAGVSIFGIYAGLRAQYYLGETVTPYPGATPYKYHQLTLGGEVGYGFNFLFFTIRPFVGFGDATTYGVGTVNADGSTSPNFTQPYVQPGGLVQFGFGPLPLMVGLEASALIPTTEGSETAFVINGEVGLRF